MIKITAPNLNKIRYSSHQQKLWEIIKEKHDTGMGYRMISYWLNAHEYKTTRGRTFKNTHVFSILKKKKIADDRIYKKYKLKIENLRIKLKII